MRRNCIARQKSLNNVLHTPLRTAGNAGTETPYLFRRRYGVSVFIGVYIMARRARKISVTANPSVLSAEEAARRAARAASILLRIAVRVNNYRFGPVNENATTLPGQDEAQRRERINNESISD